LPTLPAKLIVTLPVRVLRQGDPAKLAIEDLRKAAEISYRTFPVDAKPPQKGPDAGQRPDRR
jgi:hypothetical protein